LFQGFTRLNNARTHPPWSLSRCSLDLQHLAANPRTGTLLVLRGDVLAAVRMSLPRHG
jgi:hypothetical protein